MLNMQNVKDIEITEGNVRTIHDKDNKLIWGRLAYDTKYAGDTVQNGAPTPSSPINVNVVTGTQTVTISDGVDSEDYTISLGTIELCKIDTYQDYIYKNGDDWYVRKAITKIVLDGTESWASLGTPPVFYIANPTPDFALTSNIPVSNYFIGADNYNTGSIPSDTICFTGESATNKRMYIKYQSKFADLASFTTWLSTHNTTVYYALVTPTDTQITDTTLINELNNIHQFLTRYGYNSSVTGNLPIIINQTSL